jgi:hypothetical protein
MGTVIQDRRRPRDGGRWSRRAFGGGSARRGWLVAALVIGIMGPARSHAAQETASSPPAEPAALTAEVSFPSIPDLPLSAVQGAASEKEYLRGIEARVFEMAGRAAAAQNPVERAELFLMSANLALSEGVEPACSHLLLYGEVSPSAAKQGLTALRQAASYLDQAEAALEKAEPANAEEPGEDAADEAGDASNETGDVGGAAGDLGGEDDRVEALARLADAKQHLNWLRAFHQSFGVLLDSEQSGGVGSNEATGEAEEEAGSDETGSEDEARRAASELSRLIEQPDDTLAASAALWYAALRGRDESPKRTLRLLPHALEPVNQERMPYTWFARLMRCRKLAEAGQPAVAFALLLQLEERSFEWFGDPAFQQQVQRATALVEVQVLRIWHDQLDEERDDARTWCVERAEEIVADVLSDDQTGLLRLGRTMPLLSTPPQP